MSYLLHIATAVPEYRIQKDDLIRFYSEAFGYGETNDFLKKLNFLNKKTKINDRYSCIPDYNGSRNELYTDGNFKQPVEKRMELYRKKIIPLATDAIDKLFKESSIKPSDITHLITVSCTGLFAPGLEFLIAEQYKLQHTEKSAINFLGCYAAMKALKQANYIAKSDPKACILIVCAELCSLHFHPSEVDEDIIANLLFADGAAAAIVCGAESKHIKNKVVLSIDNIGTAFIPDTSDLMSWKLSSSAFRMHLSSDVVKAINDNIQDVVSNFLGSEKSEIDYWAIHPGGVRIVEVVQEKLGLTENNVADSLSIMHQYGNMSSPTILFILKNIFNKVKEEEYFQSKKIFTCAFGPGLNIEMINFSSVDGNTIVKPKNIYVDHVSEV